MINNPKNLMMSISNCDEIERAKEDSNHPCHKQFYASRCIWSSNRGRAYRRDTILPYDKLPFQQGCIQGNPESVKEIVGIIQQRLLAKNPVFPGHQAIHRLF